MRCPRPAGQYHGVKYLSGFGGHCHDRTFPALFEGQLQQERFRANNAECLAHGRGFHHDMNKCETIKGNI